MDANSRNVLRDKSDRGPGRAAQREGHQQGRRGGWLERALVDNVAKIQKRQQYDDVANMPRRLVIANVRTPRS
jgi:hypothetical protein